MERRRLMMTGGPLRLDLLPNPYGPSILVPDALAASDGLHLPDPEREQRLRSRVAAMHGVPESWIVLTNGADEALLMCLLAQRAWGPVVLFPPTDSTQLRLAKLVGSVVDDVRRSADFGIETTPEIKSTAPPASMAIVQSPNDPTGGQLAAPDAVRLMRRFRVLVIDERHGEYAGRSLVPLVREFDNLVVIQSFETWAGLAGLPFAYLVVRPTLGRQIEAFRVSEQIAAASVIAAHATLDDLAYVRATVRRVRDEKAHLFRTLRKLNMLQPLPSWANFLLVNVERGTAEGIARGLEARDIFVHQPDDAALSRYLRISAGTPETTRLLKEALVDMSTELP